MTQAERHSVGALITNSAYSRFFLQQKDGNYPHYPHGISTFGGAVEQGEELHQALIRELHEELGPAAEWLVDSLPRKVSTTWLPSPKVHYTLFEMVVDDSTLDQLAQSRVYEGERGFLCDRKALPQLNFIWGLEKAIQVYFAPGAELLADGGVKGSE